MLFTRCPECDTTFRVSDETLKKASGQVRCGRCASVFNAYAELHDPSAKTFDPQARPAAEASPPLPGPVVSTTPASPVTTPAPPTAAAPAPTTAPSAAQAAVATAQSAPHAAEPDAGSIGSASVADIVAEAESATVTEEPDPTDSMISPTEVERVLNASSSPPPQIAYAWPAVATASGPAAANRRWTIAAVAALVVFCFQIVHHFRSDLARNATLGPLVTGLYGAFGSKLAPHYDVHQYEILDWIATAEPNSRGLGSLKITARIQNRGPLRQPYPAVQLRLKDRWEAAVGSRLFTPAEYLPSDAPAGRLMSPGETTRAEIEVVDPGPDAYGFELDVCVEVEASLVTCGADKVFL
jgi:predicted Zn finger-like uncharacterized protein